MEEEFNVNLLDVSKEQNQLKIKNLLINFLFSIGFLILYFIIFSFILFYIYLKSPILFIFFWCFIIIFGVIIDDRFSKLRKFIFLLINIIQVII
jgi:hypothetical protein